ncbi:hypothetical protein ACPCXD_17175 [Rhodococcus sp. AB351]|uniref:hypothetical protein n=1 Tax=Rhodococcus sp. AB351 TaxID=3413280 RepID=UPI003C15F568
MSMLRGSPLRHRILFVLAVPLGAGLLSALGHLVQRRHGRPTSVSESLFAIASSLRRRTLFTRPTGDHPPAPESPAQP